MPITVDNVLEQLCDGNPDALVFLVEAYTQPVSELISRIVAGLGTAEDIEECTSDVFAAAWNKARQYDRSRGTVRTWLLILAKYQALDLRRKLTRATKPTVSAGRVNEDPVLAEVLSRERQRELVLSVRGMDAALREVFIHRYVLHTAIDDIAAQLQLSRTTVDNRLSRARRWLRGQLDERQRGGESLEHR